MQTQMTRMAWWTLSSPRWARSDGTTSAGRRDRASIGKVSLYSVTSTPIPPPSITDRDLLSAESSGLPPPLHEWLFPATGQTRDFPTLQVVLGHGDDFFASDARGKLERKAAPTPERTSSPSPNDTPNPALDRASRRRSRTMSMVGPPASFRLSVSPISEGIPKTTSNTTTRPTSNPSSSLFVPAPLTRVRTERDWKRRPRSIAFGEEDYIPGLQAPLLRRRSSRGRTSPSPPPQTATTCCACGCHASKPTAPPKAPAYATSAVQTPPSEERVKQPRTSYVSTAVQTDPPPSPPPRRRRSSSRRQVLSKRASVASASSSSSTTSDYDEDDGASTASRSRRSSAAATDITTPSTCGKVAVPPVKGNPVVMGQMQSYFRSSGYQLGDALRPVGGGGAGGGGFGEGRMMGAWWEVLDRRRTV